MSWTSLVGMNLLRRITSSKRSSLLSRDSGRRCFGIARRISDFSSGDTQWAQLWVSIYLAVYLVLFSRNRVLHLRTLLPGTVKKRTSMYRLASRIHAVRHPREESPHIHDACVERAKKIIRTFGTPLERRVCGVAFWGPPKSGIHARLGFAHPCALST